MADLVEHECGVWLNQRHEDYLADRGVGYSGMKQLFLNPIEWWNDSPHNPLREVDENEQYKLAYLRGEALHTNLLLGERLYEKVFGQRPSVQTHPHAIDNVRDLVALCRGAGLDWRGLKDDLVSRLVKAKVDAELLPVLQERFALSGKRHLPMRDHMRIRLLRQMVMKSATELKLPEGSITPRVALEKGLYEVSIYWVDENGIRQRARFDWLKPNFTGDLKSITRWQKSNFRVALLREIILRGYMIQVVHYHEARKQLRKAVAEGRVFGGNKTQRKLLERIARSDYWAWVFLFCKMDGAAQVRAIVIRPEMNQFAKAEQQREEALANFMYHREFHGGVDVPWFDPDVVWEPEEAEWPDFSVLGD